MKHLKSFNEEVNFEWEENPECVRLQNEINLFNKRLINDEIWKDFYHSIPLYYQKQKDPKFLESIIEFAKKRIEDIKIENEDDLKELKDIFNEIEDSCDDIIESVRINESSMFGENIKLDVRVYLGFTKKVLKERKGILKTDILFTNNEIQTLWPKIVWATSVIEKMGFQVGVNYRPNLVDLVFTIIKKY